MTRALATLAALTLGAGILPAYATAALPDSDTTRSDVVQDDPVSSASTTRISQMSGFNARALTVTQPDPNGVRYVGGEFTSFQAWDTGKAARVSLVDGSVDPTFPKVSGDVDAVEPDGNGGYVIGGMFGSVDGQSRTRLAHIRADGSLNPNFAPVVNNRVQSISVSGSTVIIGGLFTEVDGSTRNRLAAINLTDGSLLDWNPNANYDVMKVLVEGDDVYVGGRFTELGGSSRTLLAQVGLGARTAPATGTCLDNWDSTDCLTAFAPSMTGYAVFDLAVSGATVYATGNFKVTPSGGSEIAHLAAMENTTKADNGGVSSWNGALVGQGEALTTHNDVLYVGGQFNSAGGQSRGMGAAFDISSPLSPVLTSWNPRAVLGGSYNDAKRISDIEISGDTAYLAGSFWSLGTATGSIARNRIGAVDLDNGDATSWDPHICDWTNGVSATSYDITVSGSTAVFGGNFDCVGGLQRKHAAAIGPDGILTSWAPSVDGPVYAFASNGQSVYMGGNFSRVIGEDGSGGARARAAAVDTSGTVTNWAPSFDNRPEDALVSGSSVYLAGFFNTVDGEPRTGVAKIDAATGELDTNFDADLNAAAQHLALADGRLYMAGRFSTAQGEARPVYAAVDAATGALDPWNVGTPDHPYGTAIATMGNRVFLGGEFQSITSAGATTPVDQSYVAAVDAVTGALDLTWQPATVDSGGPVYEIAATSTAIYLGGGNGFSITDSGVTRQRLAAVDPVTGSLQSWNPQPGTADIRGLSTSAASVFIAGSFSSVGGVTRQNTAAMGRNGVVGDPWPMNPSTAQTVAITSTSQQSNKGSLVSDPPGVACEDGSDACNYGFPTGQQVSLTAVPESGATFDGWTGACTGTDPTCTLTIGPTTSFAATFSSTPTETTTFSANVLAPGASPPPSFPVATPSPDSGSTPVQEPAPVTPAGAPQDVSVTAGDASAVVSWQAPVASGSFPVTNYRAVSSPAGGTCLVTAPALTCDMSGLANGTPYTVAVQALTGAGWGAASSPSDAVTPQSPPQPSITITGTRGEVRGKPGVIVTGTTTGFDTEAILRPWIRLPGQTSYTQGTARILVDAQGDFTWQRRSGKTIYISIRNQDGTVKSNRLILRTT